MAYGENLKKLSPCDSELVLSLLREVCPSPETLLDAGCGRGLRLADALRALPETACSGIDADGENVALARENCPGAEIVSGDVCALPWPDAGFDAALCECTLSLLPEPERCLAELRRVLRPGGVLLLSDVCTASGAPAREKLSDSGAVRFLMSRGWIENAARGAGFRLLRERDCREKLIAMAAQLLLSGGEACLGADVFAALRRARAGYRLWIWERGETE